MSELGILTNTGGKYGVLRACISRVSGQYEKEIDDSKMNSRTLVFELIKHASYKN